jgi:hypothetical protein
MTHRLPLTRAEATSKKGSAVMPTSLPPRSTNNNASALSAVMLTLVAATLTMLIVLYEMNPSAVGPAASIGFAFRPTVNQSPANSYD